MVRVTESRQIKDDPSRTEAKYNQAARCQMQPQVPDMGVFIDFMAKYYQRGLRPTEMHENDEE